MTKEIILIDCDQCLLDFNQRVADIYFEIFGRYPKVKAPNAFKAANVFDFSDLTEKEMAYFQEKCKGENMWSKMKPMPGAVDFVNTLSPNFDFIVFTSMQAEYEQIRFDNLKDVGFNVKKVIAVSGSKLFNPKEAYARETKAVYFIDDLAKNFKGLHDIPTKLILLDHGYTDGANDQREGIKIDHTCYSLEEIKQNIILPHLSKRQG